MLTVTPRVAPNNSNNISEIVETIHYLLDINLKGLSHIKYHKEPNCQSSIYSANWALESGISPLRKTNLRSKAFIKQNTELGQTGHREHEKKKKDHCLSNIVASSALNTVGTDDRLVGLVVKRPHRERKIPGSNPACAGRDFFGVESYQ